MAVPVAAAVLVVAVGADVACAALPVGEVGKARVRKSVRDVSTCDQDRSPAVQVNVHTHTHTHTHRKQRGNPSEYTQRSA